MKNLTLSPTVNETRWAVRYLLFSMLFLPNLILYGASLLPFFISAPWLNLLYYCINFFAVLWIFRGFLKESICLFKGHIIRVIAVAAVMLAVYFVANWIIGYCLQVLHPDFTNVNDSIISQNAQRNYFITAIGTVFFVPVAEELLHRGLIFGVLHKKSRLLAYVVSTIIFAFIHIANYVGRYPADILLLCLVQYIPAGLCLGYAYEKTDSIFCPIIMHMAINSIGIAAMR